MSRAVRALSPTEYQALLTGLPKYCPNAVFTIAGQTYTTPQVVTLIESVLNVAVAVAPAKATWRAAIAAVDQAETTNGQTVKEVREVVALMFKNVPATLADLAIAPRKIPTPLSTAARAAANAKSKATRVARGTASKKQKATVSGNVTGVTITPVTSSATPSATAAPATGSAAAQVTAGLPAVTAPIAAGGAPHA